MTSDTFVLPTGEQITPARRGADTGGRFFEFEAIVPPGCSGPPAHRHRVEREEFTILEGTLRVRLGSEHRDLVAGESVVVEPGTVHGFSNPTDQPTRMRTRETPAGQLEPQLRLLAASGRVPPLLGLARLNVRHDLSFALHGVPDAVQRPVWRALARVADCRGEHR